MFLEVSIVLTQVLSFELPIRQKGFYMKPEKFWALVEQHHWLPRILRDLWGSLHTAKQWPNVIGHFLCPSALGNIHHIAFKPWETLDLEAASESLEFRKEDGPLESSLDETVEYRVYWHVDAEFPFTRIFYSDQTGGPVVKKEKSPNEHVLSAHLNIRSVVICIKARGGVVDGVVKIFYLKVSEKRKFKKGDPIFNIISDLEASVVEKMGYDIFLPPNSL
ncbi:hypothetical protein EXS61_00570 [Candidatus Parcubacteria bacterium]|nr:hypothetical protein [Candidatus Parcubacteria bacterium]